MMQTNCSKHFAFSSAYQNKRFCKLRSRDLDWTDRNSTACLTTLSATVDVSIYKDRKVLNRNPWMQWPMNYPVFGFKYAILQLVVCVKGGEGGGGGSVGGMITWRYMSQNADDH